MQIEITNEMLMKAVKLTAAKSDFQALVNAQIAEAMAKYLHQDQYGGTDMQRATRKFIDGIALELLEANRDKIMDTIDCHLQEKLDEMVKSATNAVISRMSAAIK